MAQLLAVEAVGGGVGVGGGIALTQGADVDGHHVGIAHDGFGEFYVGLDFANAVGGKLEFFHQADHLVADEVGLIADVGEVEEIVGLLEDNVLEVVFAIDGVAAIKVEAGIDGADVDDVAEGFVGFVEGEDEVVATTEYDDDKILGDKMPHYFRDGGIGIFGSGTWGEVAEVDDMGVGVGRSETVEVMPHVVGGCGTAEVVEAAAVVLNPHQHYGCPFKVGEIMVLRVGFDLVAQRYMERLRAIVYDAVVGGFEITEKFHLCSLSNNVPT